MYHRGTKLVMLTYHKFLQKLQMTLRAAGLNKERYAGHSFRRGVVLKAQTKDKNTWENENYYQGPKGDNRSLIRGNRWTMWGFHSKFTPYSNHERQSAWKPEIFERQKEKAYSRTRGFDCSKHFKIERARGFILFAAPYGTDGNSSCQLLNCSAFIK